MPRGTAKKNFFLIRKIKPLALGAQSLVGGRLAVAVSWTGTVTQEEEPVRDKVGTE